MPREERLQLTSRLHCGREGIVRFKKMYPIAEVPDVEEIIEVLEDL